LIDVAPAPIFTGLERLDNRVLGGVKVFCGMFIFGGVTAANMAADQAFAQVHPGISHLQTFFAPVSAGGDITNLIGMRTCLCHKMCFPFHY